jgi:hypothetical protein
MDSLLDPARLVGLATVTLLFFIIVHYATSRSKAGSGRLVRHQAREFRNMLEPSPVAAAPQCATNAVAETGDRSGARIIFQPWGRKATPSTPSAAAVNWTPARERAPGERRGALRRRSETFVPVHVAINGQTCDAQIYDRSTSGLGIVMSRTIPVGAMIDVLSPHAPDGTPWAKMEVRRCQPYEGGGYLVGGRFVDTLPWSVLLLFG